MRQILKIAFLCSLYFFLSTSVGIRTQANLIVARRRYQWATTIKVFVLNILDAWSSHLCILDFFGLSGPKQQFPIIQMIWFWSIKTFQYWGGRHSSVVLSAPTILRPQVRIPSTPSMLFSICIEIVTKKDRKQNKKRLGLAHLKKDIPIFFHLNVVKRSAVQIQSSAILFTINFIKYALQKIRK